MYASLVVYCTYILRAVELVLSAGQLHTEETGGGAQGGALCSLWSSRTFRSSVLRRDSAVDRGTSALLLPVVCVCSGGSLGRIGLDGLPSDCKRKDEVTVCRVAIDTT